MKIVGIGLIILVVLIVIVLLFGRLTKVLSKKQSDILIKQGINNDIYNILRLLNTALRQSLDTTDEEKDKIFEIFAPEINTQTWESYQELLPQAYTPEEITKLTQFYDSLEGIHNKEKFFQIIRPIAEKGHPLE